MLLQTTLNLRPPTALPLLLVDGDFGTVTLERVKEFQSNSGLLVDGEVGAVTWEKLLEGSPPTRQTFCVAGRYLYDSFGHKVVLRGINKMSVWDDDDPTGSISFPEIRKTGANAVRIVWAIRKDLKPGASDTDRNILDTLITTAKANHLIPIVELHDATGDWSRLPDVINYWLQPDVVQIIQKHQEYLLVNVANEAGNDTVSEDQFVAVYSTAIEKLRAAGIRVPLIIDASDWGKDLDRLDATASRLLAADGDRNLLFSVHLYWSKFDGADANFIRSKLQHSVNLGYPLMVGEFSAYGGWAGLDANGQPVSECSLEGAIDYSTIIQVCQEHEIGWCVWEWGPGNDDSDPLCTVMDMTPDRQFSNLKPGWAIEVAISSPYSIKNTSATPPSLK